MLDAAIRTFILPRGTIVALTRAISATIRTLFRMVVPRRAKFSTKDRVMALYGPVTLVSMPVVWVVLVLIGFALMYRSSVTDTWLEAFRISGSSLFTLGFALPSRSVGYVLVYAEAIIGLGLIALLLAYLPTIYSAFSRREVMVAQLSVRAGTPPDPIAMFARVWATGFQDELDQTLWAQWEIWFVELEESHTSLGLLSFFRSPNPDRSWITAAGVVLDAAALRMSTIDAPFIPHPAVCLRAGFLALQALGDYFGVPFDPDPVQGDPISVTREEFDAACDQLVARGVPVKADRDQCWLDFAGWRVNYDAVVTSLAALVVAPDGHWVTDRDGVARPKVPLRQGRARG